MDIAFLVIAVIGLLALSSGGSVSGSLGVQTNAPVNPLGNVPGPTTAPAPVYVGPSAPPPGPTTYTPTAAPAFNPPMAPSTQTNVNSTQLLSGSTAIATALLPLMHLGAAAGPIGAAVAAISAIALALLKAHQQRLTDAKNENAAVDQWLPVFDSFVTSVVNAYNSGQISASDAAQISQQFDQTLYSKFRSFVGQPGTAWNDQSGMAGKCDKTCTVGCCVYFGDLGPVLNNISYVLGFPTGKWGQGDPRINGHTITVPQIFPSKYSSYSRAQYTVTLN